MSKGATIPDPTVAATQGIQQQAALYPFDYLVNSLSQTGGDATLTNPATGQPQDYNFTGLGNAEVQNQVSSQMAQVLLGIQQNYGPAYIAQSLKDLQQADPTGYAAYGQLFDKIQQDISKNPPDQPLSESTQAAINNVLKSSASLSPTEQTQVGQQTGSQNASTGILLGNAPEQVGATNAVNALDQQQSSAQNEAAKYLSQGVTPSDIQFRTTQQNLADLGAFINGQTPTAEFSSLSGAQGGAAPTPNTGYQTPTLNEAQGAQSGINNANSLYGIAAQYQQSQANPYLAGLSNVLHAGATAANLAGSYQPSSVNLATDPYYLGNQSNTAPVGTPYIGANQDIGGIGASTAYDANYGLDMSGLTLQ
jgi:hypothetical protein